MESLMQSGSIPRRLGRCAHWIVAIGSSQQPMAVQEGTELQSLGRGVGERRLIASVPVEYQAPELLDSAEGAVVFDGVLHNEQELRSTLGVGEEATAATLVLDSYRRWGTSFAENLVGEYSIILWDPARDRLVCVRDRMGIYPLFVCQVGDTLWLSRSIDALALEPSIPTDVDRGVLASHLVHSWPLEDETYLRHIQRLRPAHVLIARGQDRSDHRYWDPVPRGGSLSLQSEAGERFEALFETAVRRRWEPGATGIFLSGGLDSVSVAAVGRDQAANSGGGPLALCLLFPGDENTSEEPVQRGVTEELGLDSRMLAFDDALSGRNFLEAGLEWTSRLANPLCNHWWPIYGELGVLGREHGSRTILTGMGGDEWLGVSPHYVAELMRGGHFARVAKLVSASIHSFRQPAWRMAPRLIWDFGGKLVLRRLLLTTMTRMAGTRGLRGAGRSLLDRYRARGRRIARSNLSEWDWIAPDPAVRRELAERADAKVLATISNDEDFYLHEMRRGLDHFLVSSQFEESFEVETQMGVQIRHPFLDAELVEGLCAVAPETLNEGGWSKALIRQMLDRRFPELGFERQKKILATDFWQSRCLASGEAAWDKLGGPTALADLGLVDMAAAERFKQLVFTKRKRLQAYLFWDLLNLEAWVRNWG